MIPSEDITKESPEVLQEIVQPKNDYKIEVLSSKYLVLFSKSHDVKYVILLDEKQSANKVIDNAKYKKADYKIEYFKNYIVASDGHDNILFNIVSYNDLSKSNLISDCSPTEIINVAGITQTNAELHLLTYYNEDDPDGEAGGTGVGIKCTQGGPGATHCATSSTVGPISTGCEVTCESGYYACCDDGRTLCKCIKKK